MSEEERLMVASLPHKAQSTKHKAQSGRDRVVIGLCALRFVLCALRVAACALRLALPYCVGSLLVVALTLGGSRGASAQPGPAPGPATGPPVTQSADLADLLRRAEATYPSLAAARQARRQAEAQAVAAGAPPSLILNLGRAFGTGAAGDDEDIFLSGRVELGGKRRARVEAARREVEASRAREARARSELTFQVRGAFTSLQAAAAEEQLARENLDVARTFLRLAEAQFQAGDVPETHVLRAQVEAENAEQAVVAAAAATAGQRAALNMLVGAEPGAPLAVPDVTLIPLRTLDLPSLRRLALARPDVQEAEATLAARLAAVAGARAARRPDLTVDAAHAHLDESNGNVLRVGLAFPIFDFGLTRANVNAARAAAEEQRATVELLRRQAAQEVETAYTNRAAARQQAERLGGPQIERARRLRELAELGYREGQFSYLELLDAQRAYQATYTQYLRAVAAANTAEAALERAVGGTLPDG
jgi:cobalt-zinc-cadmium efflux system outer membrane protein